MRFLIVCSLLSLTTVATCLANTAIIGGSPVDNTDQMAQFTVALYTLNDGADDYSFDCTGVVVGNEYILTAAHCLTVFDSQNKQTPLSVPKIRVALVAIKDPDHAPANILTPISSYALHPAYSIGRTYANDLAVIHLAESLGNSFTPVTLASTKQNSLKAGEATTIAGFGDTIYQTSIGYGKLNKVGVTIDKILEDGQVVLDITHGKGACFGDSGGPAVYYLNGTAVLWGIASHFLSAPYNCSHDISYTSIASYQEWILRVEAGIEYQ
jgi:secreted trypsin-like serine protease